MKTKAKQVAAFVGGIIVAVTGSLFASTVTLPYTFTSGTPARAAEMNANFSAVKTAVDDNHSRISALEAKVQGAGVASLSIYAFSELSGHSNEAVPPSCAMLRTAGALIFQTQNAGCTAAAPVVMPQGAAMQGLSCLVSDTEAQPLLVAVVARTNLTTGVTDTIAQTGASASTGLQTITGLADATLAVVDNANYAYFVHVSFDLTNIAGFTGLRLLGCKVSFLA